LVSSGSINRNSNQNSRQSTNDLDYTAAMLSEAAKNMVTNVQSLLKTVKTVEDEAARGTRALESAIEAIYQEIKLYSSYINDFKKHNIDETDHQSNGTSLSVSTNPEDLIKATKQITLATSKAIGAGNSMRQEDIIAAANMGRKAVSDLLFVSRGANNVNINKYNSHQNLEDQPNQAQILSVGLNCAIYYKELLECIQFIFNKQSLNENKQNLLLHSKNVANAVSEIIQVAEILKGSDWIDPEDPTVIAENELLGAANAIESAAKKLAILKPRSRTEVSSNFQLLTI
jgi:talin